MAVKSRTIAEYLDLELYGNNIEVERPSSLKEAAPNTLLFAKRYSLNTVEEIGKRNDIFLIASADYKGRLECSHVISVNPRLDYARVVQQFFFTSKPSQIAKTAVIGENVLLGENVSIGEYSVIGDNSVIGANTVIRHNVVVGEGVRIGNECLLKSHCVVGEDGFGFERNKYGVPIRIPHLGYVTVGHKVEIGSFSSIMRGTLDDTVIKDHVKIDDHVVIGHNAQIDEGCMLTACQVGGGTHIKRNTFLTTNCTLRNGIIIGEGVLVGIGATVTKSVEDRVVVAGNPARVLKGNN